MVMGLQLKLVIFKRLNAHIYDIIAIFCHLSILAFKIKKIYMKRSVTVFDYTCSIAPINTVHSKICVKNFSSGYSTKCYVEMTSFGANGLNLSFVIFVENL